MSHCFFAGIYLPKSLLQNNTLKQINVLKGHISLYHYRFSSVRTEKLHPGLCPLQFITFNSGTCIDKPKIGAIAVLIFRQRHLDIHPEVFIIDTFAVPCIIFIFVVAAKHDTVRIAFQRSTVRHKCFIFKIDLTLCDFSHIGFIPLRELCLYISYRHTGSLIQSHTLCTGFQIHAFCFQSNVRSWLLFL